MQKIKERIAELPRIGRGRGRALCSVHKGVGRCRCLREIDGTISVKVRTQCFTSIADLFGGAHLTTVELATLPRFTGEFDVFCPGCYRIQKQVVRQCMQLCETCTAQVGEFVGKILLVWELLPIVELARAVLLMM